MTLLGLSTTNQSQCSAFTAHHRQRSTKPFTPSTDIIGPRTTNTQLWYEPTPDNQNDAQSAKSAKDALDSGFWNAISYTEQWISQTLKESSKKGKSNPYARKELIYVCEMNTMPLAAVAGIFRRFREAREMGERHSIAEENMLYMDPRHELSTMRQTQVIIVPFCEYFASFREFEKVLSAINRARKDARDFVTDASIKKMESMEKEWNVNINGACLHPKYGEKSPKEMMEEFDNLEQKVIEEEVEKMARLNQARRSPYPTIIIEIQASPPLSEEEMKAQQVSKSENKDILEDIVLKLESIFAKSAVLHKKMEGKDDDYQLFDSIGNVAGIEEILVSNPIISAKEWIIENDPLYNPHISTFTSADASHADSAFEFVFSMLSLHKYKPYSEETRTKRYDVSSRSYLIMPKFVSCSATSLEKFMKDVKNIINAIDGLSDRVSLSLMHPEHVREEKRAPVPVIVLQWYEEKE